jgi:hypothetical protein
MGKGIGARVGDIGTVIKESQPWMADLQYFRPRNFNL